uniref:Transcription factor domain-containing protein n=2 Tax=Clonostachys TaxID=110564 RepID=A0A8H7K1E4_BIOOC
METDLLNGWHDAFQWQWEATVTLLGFLFAYPISSSAPTTRRAIYKAVECFEQFGSNNVGVARNAAEITRNLISKADLLLDRFWVGFSEAAVAEQPSSADLTPRDDLTPMTQAWHDNSSEIWGFLDLALTVDAFHSFEDFVTVVES